MYLQCGSSASHHNLTRLNPPDWPPDLAPRADPQLIFLADPLPWADPSQPVVDPLGLPSWLPKPFMVGLLYKSAGEFFLFFSHFWKKSWLILTTVLVGALSWSYPRSKSLVTYLEDQSRANIWAKLMVRDLLVELLTVCQRGVKHQKSLWRFKKSATHVTWTSD